MRNTIIVVFSCGRGSFSAFSAVENTQNRRNGDFHFYPGHGRLLSLINVYMCTLLFTALLPAPCACAAAVRSSVAIFTTAADLNAVFFFCKKKNIFLFCFAQNRIFNNMVRRFSKGGDFSIVSPAFCCQGCLSRNCLDAVCQWVKIMSPEIFGPHTYETKRIFSPVFL